MAHKVFNDDWITLDPSSPFEPYVHIKSTSMHCTPPPPEVVMEQIERNMVDMPTRRGSSSKGALRAQRALADWYDYCVPPMMRSWIRSATTHMGKGMRDIGILE